MKRLLLVFALLFCAQAVNAQVVVSKVTVYDRVTDVSGAPRRGYVTLFLVAQNTTSVYVPGGLAQKTASLTAVL